MARSPLQSCVCIFYLGAKVKACGKAQSLPFDFQGPARVMKSSNSSSELTFILDKNSSLPNRKAALGGSCWGRIALRVRSGRRPFSSRLASADHVARSAPSPSTGSLEGWGTSSIRAATSRERTSGCALPPLCPRRALSSASVRSFPRDRSVGQIR